MYNQLETSATVVSSLKSGVTYNAIYLLPRFLFMGGSFNLVFQYSQYYYFTYEEQINGDYKYYLNMTMTPTGLGIDFANWTSTTTFPTANYAFELTSFDPVELTFTTTSSYSTNKAGLDYYNNSVTNDIIDGFKNKTFRLQWSEVASNYGLIAEFRPVGLSENQTHATNFIPPVVLSMR